MSTIPSPGTTLTVDALIGETVRVTVNQASATGPTVPIAVTAGNAAAAGAGYAHAEMTKPTPGGAAGAASSVNFTFGLAPGSFNISAQNLTRNVAADVDDTNGHSVAVFDYSALPIDITVNFL